MEQSTDLHTLVSMGLIGTSTMMATPKIQISLTELSSVGLSYFGRVFLADTAFTVSSGVNGIVGTTISIYFFYRYYQWSSIMLRWGSHAQDSRINFHGNTSAIVQKRLYPLHSKCIFMQDESVSNHAILYFPGKITHWRAHTPLFSIHLSFLQYQNFRRVIENPD